MGDAVEWEAGAMAKRPWRTDFFAKFGKAILALPVPPRLGMFEAIVTPQAVHELRHKDRARGLHAQAAALLAPGGAYLVCDHFAGEGGMKDDQLSMTVKEQAAALNGAGFDRVEQLLLKGGLVLHRASVRT